MLNVVEASRSFLVCFCFAAYHYHAAVGVSIASGSLSISTSHGSLENMEALSAMLGDVCRACMVEQHRTATICSSCRRELPEDNGQEKQFLQQQQVRASISLTSDGDISTHGSESGLANQRNVFVLADGATSEQQIDQQLHLQLPVITPTSRTYYSSDPQISADWWLRYIRGTRIVDPWWKTDPACAETVAVELQYQGETMTMLFIKDKVKATGELNPDVFVNSSDREWGKVMDRIMDYSPWVDFHDGMTWSILDIDALARDNVLYQRYLDVVLRLNVPRTVWTLELVMINQGSPPPIPMTEKGKQSWLTSLYNNPDSCRNSEAPNATHFWWKSTFAAADPVAAVKFATQVLGAVQIESPYPWPPVENCTAALWVRFPTNDGSHGIEFHFVESLEYPPGSPSIADFHHYQNALRDLEKGRFDRYLYNSIVFRAPSLDPFIERLNHVKCPFLLLDLKNDLFSLYFVFPGNGAIAMQIHSSHVTLAGPRPYSSCSSN
eukprot:TRINITY_DN94757_c0_g1_i1.p1 TRINITY_DN94757_c0_g1~~TRINITY_DN94757_c0_g1_i1.p1  ORF type:complete len:495 (+),score=66.16 TRINITY_DN94757_c0_g1_i1:67-1551(+)